jgi:sulfide dehydrogenase cytochrome subunit
MTLPARHLARLAAMSVASAIAGTAYAQYGQAAAATNPQLGRDLAATCANCHGTNGRARGDMKPLAGVPAEKIVAMMTDYKNGNQPATIMHQIAKGYTDDQIKLVAAYFATQTAKK